MDDFYTFKDTKPEGYDHWIGVLTRQLATFRTAKGQRDKLMAKGCPVEFVDDLIELGRQIGGIDDCWYARSFVQSHGTWALRRLRDELRARGISAADLQQVLEEEQIDDLERALPVATEFHRRQIAEHKALARMARLGYSYSIARQAWIQVCNEAEDEDE